MFHAPACSSVLACCCRTLLAILAFAVVGSNRLSAESLDQQLLRHAPQVLKYCQAKGYRNVGVLKFRVKKGQGALTDSIGPLNLDVACQLELALLLTNRVQQPVGIVHNASEVAATIPGANHLVAAGRPPLFAQPYPLAWGSEQVTPEAFLTGVIYVSDDLKRLAVGIVAFDREHPLEKVVEFDADADPFDLIDVGESFLIRGALDDDEQQLAQVVMSANRVRTRVQQHPLQDPNAPIELEIRYDNELVPIEFRGGQAIVREPLEGQQVSFILKRKPPDRSLYAVVLKVNGLNSLYTQRLPDLDCSKWVLEPDRKEINVAGFQLNDQEVMPFKVLSKAASAQREMDYGADVGTISLVVFREGMGPQPNPAELLDDFADDLAALSRERFPTETPRNLSALKAQLRRTNSRGLIDAGEVIEGKTRMVKFEAYPIPLMSATITYYQHEGR